MLIECSLVAIKECLENTMITCSIKQEVRELSTDYLVIDMGKDEKKRPQLIELFAVHKEITEGAEEHSQVKKSINVKTHNDHPNFLHMHYFFPFKFRDGSVNDIARFLLLINKGLEFNGFGMSEVDRLIYFRHDLFCYRSKVNTKLLKGLLGYILLMADSFGPTIEKLALQETTFQEVIAKMLSKE